MSYNYLAQIQLKTVWPFSFSYRCNQELILFPLHFIKIKEIYINHFIYNSHCCKYLSFVRKNHRPNWYKVSNPQISASITNREILYLYLTKRRIATLGNTHHNISASEGRGAVRFLLIHEINLILAFFF